MPREIISIACGDYSNQIFSHLWKIQETSYDDSHQIDPACMHRQIYSDTQDSPLIPRFVSIDAQNTPNQTSPPTDEIPDILWPKNKITLIGPQELIKPQEYPPKKLLTGNAAEFFAEKVRHNLEDCDYFQGFFFAGDLSSLSCWAVDELMDNSGKVSCLMFSPLRKEQGKFDVVDLCMSLKSLEDYHRLAVIPLSLEGEIWGKESKPVFLPHIIYENELQSSAVLACAIETCTTSLRLKNPNDSLWELVPQLTANSRLIGSLGISLPFELRRGLSLYDSILKYEDSLTTSLLPYNHRTQVDDSVFFHHSVLRGVGQNRLFTPGNTRLSSISTCRDLMEAVCGELSGALRCSAVTVKDKLKTCFLPDFFDGRVDKFGEVGEDYYDCGVAECAVLGSMECSTSPRYMLEAVRDRLRRTDVRRIPQFAEIELEGFDESVESLNRLIQHY